LDWLFNNVPELLDLKDKFEKTAFDYAIEKGNAEVLEWFSKHTPSQSS
jgi:ankyrin repeat protein